MNKCEHDNCTRKATIMNNQYHPDKWLCTYHANKIKGESPFEPSTNHKINSTNNTD